MAETESAALEHFQKHSLRRLPQRGLLRVKGALLRAHVPAETCLMTLGLRTRAWSRARSRRSSPSCVCQCGNEISVFLARAGDDRIFPRSFSGTLCVGVNWSEAAASQSEIRQMRMVVLDVSETPHVVLHGPYRDSGPGQWSRARPRSRLHPGRRAHETVIHIARINVVSGNCIGIVVATSDGALAGACARARNIERGSDGAVRSA